MCGVDKGTSITELIGYGRRNEMSVIALKHGPTHWIKVEKPVQVSEAGTASQMWRSIDSLKCLGPEKQ